MQEGPGLRAERQLAPSSPSSHFQTFSQFGNTFGNFKKPELRHDSRPFSFSRAHSAPLAHPSQTCLGGHHTYALRVQVRKSGQGGLSRQVRCGGHRGRRSSLARLGGGGKEEGAPSLGKSPREADGPALAPLSRARRKWTLWVPVGRYGMVSRLSLCPPPSPSSSRQAQELLAGF